MNSRNDPLRTNLETSSNHPLPSKPPTNARRTEDLRAQAGKEPEFDGCTWYLLQSKPQGEHLAMINLLRQHYRIWLPLCTLVTRHGRKTETRRAPFFPRYLFVGRRADQPFGPIMNTIGVSDIVKTAESAPAEVRRVYMEQVSAELVKYEKGIRQPKAQANPFKKGDWLRVTEGPFTSFAGLCTMSADQRVHVLLSMFGRETPVELPPDCVELVRESDL